MIDKQKITLISQISAGSNIVFQSFWKDDSVWQWLIYISGQAVELEKKESRPEIEDSYFRAVVNSLDDEKLSEISRCLQEMNKYFSDSDKDKIAEVNIGDGGDDILEFGRKMDLSQEGTDRLKNLIGSLSSENRAAASVLLKELTTAYTRFRFEAGLAASLLLYYQPSETVPSLKALGNILADPKTAEIENKEQNWPSVMRFLGQAVYGHDGAVKDMAVTYLFLNPPDEAIVKNYVYRLFYLSLIYIAFKDFADLRDELQQKLLSNQAFAAMRFGFPLESVIKEKLAEEPTIEFYLKSSGLFAQALVESHQPLLIDDPLSATMGEFIKKYLFKVKENDGDEKNQKNYVDEEMLLGDASEKNNLLRLLNLYIHLRDADLIDYHALLSEGGAMKKVFDWKELIKQDLDVKKTAEIREYFKLINRPIKLQIELVAAFLSVPWTDEPYFSRILALNDIYAEVYPEPYGSLVYYDESADKWTLKREFPPEWKTMIQTIRQI